MNRSKPLKTFKPIIPKGLVIICYFAVQIITEQSL